MTDEGNTKNGLMLREAVKKQRAQKLEWEENLFPFPWCTCLFCLTINPGLNGWQKMQSEY